MTPVILVDTLVEFIKPVVEEFELQSNIQGVKKAPQVVADNLLAKKPPQQQDTPDFPYVIVRFIEDNDTAQGNMATVRVYAGTYSEDYENGWRDPLNVITRIKEALLEKRFIGGPFKVEYPVNIEFPEEQPYPEWVAALTLNVSIPHVQEEGGYIKDVF